MRSNDRPSCPASSRGDWFAVAIIISLAIGAAAGASSVRPAPPTEATGIVERDAAIERGRYVVRTGGCNDCHTAGYAESAGETPEADWLTGSSVGWTGSWGAAHAGNLRRYFASLSAPQWLAVVRGEHAPSPMPWYALRAMTDTDLLALYRYLQFLGPSGEPPPAGTPPERKVRAPLARVQPPADPGSSPSRDTAARRAPLCRFLADRGAGEAAARPFWHSL